MASTFNLVSTVRGVSTVGGLRVEAWDATGLCTELVDVARTDAHGRFSMAVTSDYVAALLTGRPASLVFRVFDASNKQLDDASHAVWSLTENTSRLSMNLGPGGRGAQPSSATVRGTIAHSNGLPAANVTVRAFDRNLGASGFIDTELGHAVTATDGHYEIHYAMPAGGKLKPDLIVRVDAAATQPQRTAVGTESPMRVAGGAGEGPPATSGPHMAGINVPGFAVAMTSGKWAAESKLISSAPTVAMVDLGLEGSVSPLLSEHHSLTEAASSVLLRSRLNAADLKPEHIEYVAGASGTQPSTIRNLQQATKLSRDTGGAVDPEVFYGLVRNGMSGSLDALVDQPLAKTRKRLRSAIQRNHVSSARGGQIDQIATKLLDAAVAHAIPATGTTVYSAALANSLAPKDVHQTFMRTWIGRTGAATHAWDAVRADPTLAPHADDLELTLRLHVLFGGFQPALGELKARRQAGSVKSLRDLARWDDSEWTTLLRKTGVPPGTAGETDDAKLSAYGAALQGVVRKAFPSEYLRARAAKPVAPLSTTLLSKLAAANPSLDLRRPLPANPNWGDIAAADQEKARIEWNAFRGEAATFRTVPARTLLSTITAAAGSNPIRTAANKVLSAATNLDLELTTVDQYLAAHPTALAAVDPAQKPAVIGYMQSMQRVVRLVDKPEAVEHLLAGGFDSSMRIARTSRARFVQEYSKVLGGDDAAHATYAKAFSASTTTQLALTTVSQSLVDVSPWVVRGGQPGTFEAPDRNKALQFFKNKAKADDATWPVLFGSDAWCDCEECKSAFGPAAYFTDLVHMIDTEGDASAPANELFARRADLLYLPLTCDNTNTPIPYIDLVNEILEMYIATSRGLATAQSYDNEDITASELRAVPQNVIPEVYDFLAKEVYPFALPFHRALAVMRTYLDQLGTSYRDVFDAFGPRGDSEDLSQQAHLAAEDLGLSPRQFKLIADVQAPGNPDLSEYYGYKPSSSTWMSDLSLVTELLTRTGISYDDLYKLSTSFFVNPGNTVVLETPVNCDINNTHLQHTTTKTWNRLHRFLRLWRSSDWSIEDLDRVLFALGARAADGSVLLNTDTLQAAGLARRVATELDMPLISVTALWANIDMWGSDSLYQRLFLNKTVARVAGGDDAAFALDATYDPEHPELKPADGTVKLNETPLPGEQMPRLLKDHLPRVLAALRISSDELDTIQAHAFPAEASPPLTVKTLSMLYRYTVLAKGTELRIADLVTLLTLTGAKPFTSPAATLAFIDLVEVVTESGFDIATLDYVYRHVTQPGQGPAPADSVVFETLDKIREVLAAVRQDTAVTDDPDGTLLTARLTQLQPADIVARILDALDPSKGLDAATRSSVLQTYLGPTLQGAEQQVLPPHVTDDPTTSLPLETDDVTSPNYPTYEVALAARIASNRATILALISDWLRQSLGEAAVISSVAASLGVSDAIARRLLVDWIPGDGQATALTTLLELAGGGLTAHFFTAPLYGGNETTADDELVSAQLATTSDYQSIHWKGSVLPLGDGEHVFVVRTDSAGSIKVAGVEATFVAGTAVTDHELHVTLTEHELAPIEVKYDGGSGGSKLDLLWRLATSTTPQPVPADVLFGESGVSVLDDETQGPGLAWRRAHKAALLISGFGLTEAELDYVQLTSQPIGDFKLSGLPMVTPDDDALPAHLARWQQIANLVAVRSSLPASDVTLTDVLTLDDPAARKTEWVEYLCDATGWDIDTVDSLLDDTLLQQDADWAVDPTLVLCRLLRRVAGSPPDTGALDPGDRLSKLQDCIDLIKRVGVSGDALRAWTVQTPTSDEADQVIQAVRARYSDDAEWFQVAQTRNDVLRQQQRDALVAYILPRKLPDGTTATDENSLFEYFLIDVEMCACGITSRVKQAISSVQTFIQRILLGLEKGISPDTIDSDKWKWNSIYRIWQANREIFLYPENWIDPELRVNKTPFFGDLQSQLSQGPLEDETVEDAFREYLEKLVEVSRLKICAVHWQREGRDSSSPIAPDDEIDIVHVVARTPGGHPTFYYRQLIGAAAGNGGTEWTPWEKIDVDILGDSDSGDVQMVLTTFNRRLYMFWGQFSEEPKSSQPGMKEGDSPPDPLTKWKISLAWSTYRNGVWSPKQVSNSTLTSKRYMDSDDVAFYDSEYQQFTADRDAAKSKLDKAKEARDDAEDAFWAQLMVLEQNLLLAADSWMLGLGLPGLGISLVQVWVDLIGSDLDSFEENCADSKASVEDVLGWIYDFAPVIGATLSPTLKSLEKLWDNGKSDSVMGARDVVADRKATYDELNEKVENFDKGKTNLAIPDQTGRTDHSFWLSSAGDDVTITVLRHDETTNPRQIGYFTLSEDGRSVDAESLDGHIDVSDLMPADSTPYTNRFKLDDTANGLDLDSLPNVIQEVDGISYYSEHWMSKPVTADRPRPFFIAGGGEVHIGLPYTKQKSETDWITAFVQMPKSPTPSNSRSSSSTKSPMVTLGGLQIESTGNLAANVLASKTSFGVTLKPANAAKIVALPKPIVFEPFHHPYAKDLVRRLERDGVDGLLTIEAQNPDGDDKGGNNGHFAKEYVPSTKYVATPYSPYNIDFRTQGPYAQYNWELFFHAPHLIASRLMQDARYEEARDWLHYIFNPTTTSTAPVPKRFWNVQWFRDHGESESADELMTALAANEPADLVAQIQAQIDQWIRYPADPHRIAQLRTSAYQKAIFFKYVDNLIAWGDSLFTQNTIETINQATQLYIFASHLLGPRPEHVPQEPDIEPITYAAMRGGLDSMSDMLALVESSLHPEAISTMKLAKTEAHALIGISHLPLVQRKTPQTPDAPEEVTPQPLVFCVPPNSKLLGYFDTIDDRLFKIRNCMNIEGVVQKLPLFEPPIDPAMLVKAAAMGLDIGSILADLSAPLPFHRFATMAQKANEVCNEVKSLGGQLLSAIEKKDAEHLAVLRATHETSMYKAIKDVKKQQLADAKKQKEALEKTRATTQAKHDYYASRAFMSPLEIAQTATLGVGLVLNAIAAGMSTGAAAAHVVPNFALGPTGMGVHGTGEMGGSNVGQAASSGSKALQVAASIARDGGQMVGLLAGWDRRQDEWDFQKDLAKKELAQIDKQLAAADIKIAIAQLELSNQQLQIDHAKKVEDTLRTKYTNAELYQWMITQISTTYYQAYKLAYDLAKRAERCYRYELGIPSSSFIQFGYWDSMRKGLLAGEQLALDLKRLEAAYLQSDRRDYEITRQVSLVLHEPSAFVKLRETGSCEITLPEELFDADYPGHYFRRLKTVSLTLPCVAGPYTPINCTLTLLSSSVRTASTASKNYSEQDAPNDPRFSHSYGAIQSVSTSHGQNDAGLFEVNFRDDRYLPFEGAGAISTWRIDLPKDTNAFDFDTLSDVILKLQYTAREGGAPLAASARTSLDKRRKTAEIDLDPSVTNAGPLERLFRVRYEFSDQWIAFRNALAKGDAVLSLPIDVDRFPYRFRSWGMTITGVKLYATGDAGIPPITLQLTAPGINGDSVPVTLTPAKDPTFLSPDNDWPSTTATVKVSRDDAATWKVSASASQNAAISTARDLLLLVTYNAKAPK